uniref:NADH:ubiquinone reductase (H(+)-translocating) n=1 Tax=Epanerchodus koreanus TaxID=2678661 RepID=A0A7L8HYX4_9MYRI|nr:NADH dehydrogenase subunit 5 [Epanerchodus koreanus]QOE55885.1 NADH dehydrogenase subunit 5 [Epanerchodus koreanus]
MWLYEIIILFLFILSMFCFGFGFYVLFYTSVFIVEYMFFSFFGIDFSLLLLFDWMSLFFGGVVLLVSFCVVMYSIWYMYGDYEKNKFILLVLMFILSMIVVIFSPSMISILLGWDGLGLVSYCLVIYYYNYSSYSAGMITGIMNRFGDVFLLLTVGLMFSYGSWNFYLMDKIVSWELYFIYFFIMIGGFTKSAQIPFSAWLPAAMAAPTPVSALVHSSTLVTAGVYLLIRFYYLFESSWLMMSLFFYLGLLTSFMAGFSANYEVDLKKIIALSTLSQLGIMMVSVGLGNLELAYFHLIIHAVFKALLFLCGGKIIHLMGGYQDIRFMGGISHSMIVSLVCLNIANFSLCGIPFMSGFYSSDLIFEMFGFLNINIFGMLIFFMCGFFSCMYSLSFFWVSSLVFYCGNDFNWSDNEMFSLIPELILSFFGIIFGSLMFWLGIPEVEEIVVFGMNKFWPLIMVLLSLIFGMLFLYFFLDYLFHEFFYVLFYIFDLSSYLARIPLFSMVFTSSYDIGWGEIFGVYGMNNLIDGVGKGFLYYRSKNFLILLLIFVFSMFIFFMLI